MKEEKKNRIKIKNPSKIYATVISTGPNSGAKKDNNGLIEKGYVKLSNLNIDPNFSYAMCKRLDGMDTGGTTSWWQCRASKGYGLCPGGFLQDFEIDNIFGYKKLIKTSIPDKILNVSREFNNKTGFNSAYERLMGLKDILHIVDKNMPVILCFDIFDNIDESRTDGIIRMPEKHSKKIFSHSVCLLENISKNELIRFVNSWGYNWGDNGFGYLSYDYIKKYLLEAWVTISSDRLIKEIDKFVAREYFFKLSLFKSFLPHRSDIYCLDVYGSKENKRIVAWSHFRLHRKQKKLYVEEFFVLPEFRSNKIGTEMFKFIEDFGNKKSINSIEFYIHVQDLVDEKRIKIINNFIDKFNFEVEENTKKFKGCMYKIYKNYAKDKTNKAK